MENILFMDLWKLIAKCFIWRSKKVKAKADRQAEVTRTYQRITELAKDKQLSLAIVDAAYRNNDLDTLLKIEAELKSQPE